MESYSVRVLCITMHPFFKHHEVKREKQLGILDKLSGTHLAIIQHSIGIWQFLINPDVCIDKPTVLDLGLTAIDNDRLTIMVKINGLMRLLRIGNNMRMFIGHTAK